MPIYWLALLNDKSMNRFVPFTDRAPALVAASGERAAYRFFEFFSANILNRQEGLAGA